jgi:4-hydroxy-tetrahydrodipicolinate synthase
MFSGVYTAIVTPFNKNGKVDYECLKGLLKWQIEQGVDGVVPVGTTGESPTLDFDEHKKVIESTIEVCKGKIQVIAGTGANATDEALELTEFAAQVGADATLQVTPYYNKPTAEGQYRHFSKIADIGLPVVLYNIPSRCGVEIPMETVKRLSQHPKVVAIKEAGGNLNRVSQILCETSLTVLSGDDSLTLPMMAVGARGVISVASNIMPKEVATMVHNALNGNWAEARALHLKLFSLFTDLFIETSPIPIKAAMAMKGLIEEIYRLPLCEMTAKGKEKLIPTLKKFGII